ncbi:MAG: hypothetical protein ACP5IO_06280 [Elusimicrobiales bacterium]
MNKDIIVISAREENIKKMKTILDLCGYKGYFASDLNDVFSITEKFVPLSIVIVEEEEAKTEIFLKEIKRYMSLIPVIIMMSEKDHIKREKYISIGANIVIEFPWSDVDFAKKIEMLEIKNIEVENRQKESKKRIKNQAIVLSIFLFIFVLALIIPVKFLSKTKEVAKKDFFSIPSTSISGFIKKDNKLYVYDWVIQSFYVFDYQTKELIETKKFFTPYIITLIKDTTANFFFAITDSGEIKKFLKDNRFTEFSSTLYPYAKDLCYDGMYVWIANDEYLIKALNNDLLTPVERYPLKQELSKIQHIACAKNNIYYYINNTLIKTEEKRPFDKISKISLPYRILFIDLMSDEKIAYIKQDKEKSQLFEIEIRHLLD